MVSAEPVRGSIRAVDVVVDQLRGWIVEGNLGAGTLLPPERDLAASLGVSRPTLRQGLSILGQMGLVASVRGRNGGIRVTTPSAATVASSVTLLCQTNAITAAQLTEVRRGLEVEAAQLAAAQRTDDELARIAEALDAYVASEADVVRASQWGRRLHYLIAQASHNPLLVELLHSLDLVFAECVALLWAMPGLNAEIESVHRPIVEAIAARTTGQARQAMVRHFDQIERALAEHGVQGRLLGERRLPAGSNGTPPRAAKLQPRRGVVG